MFLRALSLRTIFGCTAACCLLLLCCGTAQSADFIPLGFESFAEGVSGDGSFAVGWGPRSYADTLRWTSSGDALDLGDLPGALSSNAISASLTGSVVVGHSQGPSPYLEAFRWTEADGMVGLGLLPGYLRSWATDVSVDGSIVVGHGGDDFPEEAFVWTEGAGMVGLGTLLGDTRSRVRGISADGSVVVGVSADDVSGVSEAIRWTDGGGMQGLGALPGASIGSDAYDTSADGSIIVGVAESVAGVEAFRWTAGNGMVGLGDLPGGDFHSLAEAVSADGSVVVGYSRTSFDVGDEEEAFVWDATNGMRLVEDVLTDAGLDMTGWQLNYARGVSDDGNTIVGWGTNPDGQQEGWIARLAASPVPEPSTFVLASLGLSFIAMRRKR
jgi:probable HAF family extracellular repeat protein